MFAAGTEYELRDIKPTALSEAAATFNAARKQLADAATVPKWTAKVVSELKKQCDAKRELVDQLRTPAGGPTGPEPKIATRLSGLAAGLAAWEKLLDAK